MPTKSENPRESQQKPAPKKGLEFRLLKNIQRAAKKSEDPSKIANAYGILIDKIVKSNGLLLKEIRATAIKLLNEIDRAAKKSADPNHVAIAFGILKDKNAFGPPGKSDESKYDLTPKQRKKEYKELIKLEYKAAGNKKKIVPHEANG